MNQTVQNNASALLVESSIDAMIAIDPQNRVTTWNSAAGDLFGRRAPEVFGRMITDIIPDLLSDKEYLNAISSAQEGNKNYLQAEKEFSHRSHAETHFIPLIENGTQTGVLLLVHDVSHRLLKENQLGQLNEQLQQRLKQIQSMRKELGHLASIATNNLHEPVRTMYTAIENLISTEGKALSDRGRASFRRIQSSLNRMNLLLGDLVTMNQIHIAEPTDEIVDVAEVLNEVLELKSLRISENAANVIRGKTCKIRARRNQLALLLQHVLADAIKFNSSTPPIIKVESAEVQLPPDDNLEVPPGRYFRLTVTYTGRPPVTAADTPSIEKPAQPHEPPSHPAAISSIIAATILDAHGGWLVIAAGDTETVVNSYFPVTGAGVNATPPSTR